MDEALRFKISFYRTRRFGAENGIEEEKEMSRKSRVPKTEESSKCTTLQPSASNLMLDREMDEIQLSDLSAESKAEGRLVERNKKSIQSLQVSHLLAFSLLLTISSYDRQD